MSHIKQDQNQSAVDSVHFHSERRHSAIVGMQEPGLKLNSVFSKAVKANTFWDITLSIIFFPAWKERLNINKSIVIAD